MQIIFSQHKSVVNHLLSEPPAGQEPGTEIFNIHIFNDLPRTFSSIGSKSKEVDSK